MKAEPKFNNCTKATCPWNFNMDFWEEKISQPFTRRSLKEEVLSSLPFKTNIANILTPYHSIAIYGDWSWFPTWLYLKSNKIQPTGHTCEGCLLSSFEIERPVLNLDQLRLEDPSQIWVTPSGGSPHKKYGKRHAHHCLAKHFSLITLNINSLNQPIKIHILTELVWKQDPFFPCITSRIDITSE